MSEALGLMASIIAVIQISDRIITSCYDYYRTASNAKEDINNIINVVSGLKSTLENLRSLRNEQENRHEAGETRKNLKCLSQGGLNQCEKNIRDLAKLLGYENIETNLDPKRVKVTLIK